MIKIDFLLNHEVAALIGEIDEFKGRWETLNKLKPEVLYSLKHVATIESIGSSTRIEGVKLTDLEIETLLKGIKKHSFATRDEEEVAGYAEAMELVFSSFEDIEISENYLKQLHKVVLKHSQKDYRHRGEYKKFPNNVEAFNADGKSVGIVFETASPFETERRMKEMLEWTHRTLENKTMHPLIIVAVFIIHFLAIHPFQDGNGRLSRILTTLFMLKLGYEYVPYSSLEKVVEQHKSDYYLALRSSQVNLEKDSEVWIIFFLKMLRAQKDHLLEKLKKERLLMKRSDLSVRILHEIKERGSITISEIEVLTEANRNTIKLELKTLVKDGMIELVGGGRASKYIWK